MVLAGVNVDQVWVTLAKHVDSIIIEIILKDCWAMLKITRICVNGTCWRQYLSMKSGLAKHLDSEIIQIILDVLKKFQWRTVNSRKCHTNYNVDEITVQTADAASTGVDQVFHI